MDIKKEIESLVLTILASALLALLEVLQSGNFELVGWASLTGLFIGVLRTAIRPLIPAIIELGRKVAKSLTK